MGRATHLARAGSSTTTNTGNTSYSTTGTPRLGTSLVSSFLGNGVCLPFVFGDALCTKHCIRPSPFR